MKILRCWCSWFKSHWTTNFLLKLIYPSLRSNTKLTTLPTLCVTGRQSPNLRVSEYPPMKIVTESKSESFRIPPQNENCHRVQIWEFQNTSPKWKLSQSPNPRVSEYPPKWKLSQSPNPRVSEYPPKMKIVTESKSESFRIPPQNENCHSTCWSSALTTITTPDITCHVRRNFPRSSKSLCYCTLTIFIKMIRNCKLYVYTWPTHKT